MTIEPERDRIHSLAALIRVAEALCNPHALSTEEKPLGEQSTEVEISNDLVENTRRLIIAGRDPLGDAYGAIQSAPARRKTGAVYTPPYIVESMLAWAQRQIPTPCRIVDPGAGSGRFILAAARRFPKSALIAVESDPLASLMLKANVTVLGLNRRLVIEEIDYRSLSGLPLVAGPTLFVGNPPYVRHHDITPEWKNWFFKLARARRLRASKLAGLHVHFFLKTLELAKRGDYGAFITASEWLDVNYGSVLRDMLINGLGGVSLHILSPKIVPFENAATTATITCFRVGAKRSYMHVRNITSPDMLLDLRGGKSVATSLLAQLPRWSPAGTPKKRMLGTVRLGDLFSVHRGQATGSNRVWLEGSYHGRIPVRFLFPTITRASELLVAKTELTSTDHLKRVIDLPEDLDSLDALERRDIDEFLDWAITQGARDTYIAKHRKPWWSVRLRQPAPILCTYMARRPPVFVRNTGRAHHINIAHGLYPKMPIPEVAADYLLHYLRTHVTIDLGRTYAGGLTKFEPKEVESIPIPSLEEILEKTQGLEFRTA